MLLLGIVALCGLIWLLILVYYMANKGPMVLLGWLLVAPIVVNIVEKPLNNPLFGQMGRKPVAVQEATDPEARKQKQAAQVARASTAGMSSLRVTELLSPMRTVFILFLAVFLLESIVRRRRLLPLNNTEMWMVVFALILILSALLQSKRMANSLRVAVDAFVVPFLGYYITRRLVATADNYRRFVTVMAYFGLYVSFIVVLDRLSVPGLTYRVSGPFETDNQLYAAMVAVLFLMLGETGAGRNSGPLALPVWLRWSVIGLVPLVIFATWARSNWLGFLAGSWAFMFFARRLVPISQRIAAAGLILLLIPIAGFGVQTMMSSVEGIQARVTRTDSILARLAAWQIVIQKGLENPLTGIGFKNAEAVLLTERTYLMGVKNETDAHNGFLTIFAENGAPGVIVYVGLLLSILLFGLGLYRKGITPQDKWRGVSVIALMVAYLTPVSTTTILQVPSICHAYVFVCLGAIAGLYTGRSPKAVLIQPNVMPKYAKDRRVLSG